MDADDPIPEPPPPPPPARRLRRGLLLGGAAALVVVLVAGALVLRPHHHTHTIDGVILDYNCTLTQGDPVTLKNQDGTVIASASTVDVNGGHLQFGSFVGCGSTWTFTDVPDAKFYTVTIGTHPGPSYSEAELQAAGWKMSLNV